MAAEPLDVSLEMAPSARFDVVDLRSRFEHEHRQLADYPQCLYWSAHTTAGFLDRSLGQRLTAASVPTYLDVFRTVFPAGADYEHDRLERREDLDPAQRAVEPRNADSHLAFIASGLHACVTYPNRPNEPVCFVDLDGVADTGTPRRRTMRMVGFNRERVVDRLQLRVPVSAHPIDSINLKDARLGIAEALGDMVARAGIGHGRLQLALSASERHSGLTINEYETLLMKVDLPEVLRNPLRFAAEKTRHVLSDPFAVPGKALGYAKYDFVRLMNSSLEALGPGACLVERLVARTIAVPAARFFRMRRSINLLVAKRADGTVGFVEGTYQSPILVQWREPERKTRTLDVTLTELS